MALLAVALASIVALQQPDTARVASPDGRTVVLAEITDGKLHYSVKRDARDLMLPSLLGIEFRNAPPLRDRLRITRVARNTVDQTWTQPWGEVARVRDHHNELRVRLVEDGAALPGRQFDVVFRVFNDGIGFRYEVPEQANFAAFEIQEELTEFAFVDDARAWSIPSNRKRLDRSEMLYSSSPLSLLDSVQTPLTLEMRDLRTVVVLHEANLVDYPRMFLAGRSNMEHRTLRAALAPWRDGVKVRGTGAFNTPWRTIQIADRIEDLVPSVLGLNLNPPSVIANTRWITPMKYVGIWWGMHINTMTWGSGPKHGATTENTRRYIDFAAANGFGGVLVEGWNTGWDGDWIANRNAFSFTQPYPDYDLRGLAAYARQKGVRIIAHNETSGGIENYERQMEEAFALYQALGINAIKSGYVTDTLTGGHSHYGQYAVRHHRKVIETAAKYGIMLDVHEPVHDTGERRTYPNVMTREGSRGQEYNAWGGEGGNPPEHETILFFTRMLSGPMDFTPGIFDILIQRPTGQPRKPQDARVRTTLAKQLALYVVLYSPMQMAADEIENYANQPAFQFIRDVAVDWEQTKVLDASIGDYVIVARQKRNSDEWFIGAITDEERRTFDVPLTFLPSGKQYVAEIYRDGPNAHWLDNPLPVAITRQDVTSTSVVKFNLAAGGGQAIRLRPAR